MFGAGRCQGTARDGSSARECGWEPSGAIRQGKAITSSRSQAAEQQARVKIGLQDSGHGQQQLVVHSARPQ